MVRWVVEDAERKRKGWSGVAAKGRGNLGFQHRGGFKIGGRREWLRWAWWLEWWCGDVGQEGLTLLSWRKTTGDLFHRRGTARVDLG
jgi:hypothetical protein